MYHHMLKESRIGKIFNKVAVVAEMHLTHGLFMAASTNEKIKWLYLSPRYQAYKSHSQIPNKCPKYLEDSLVTLSPYPNKPPNLS